ncbi:MAG: leucine--tRNA ligase, partial [Desulfurococcaceae archaeon]
IISPEWKREIARMFLDGKSMKEIIDTMRSRYGLRGREHEVVYTYNAIREMNKSLVDKIVRTKSRGEFEVYSKTSDYILRRVQAVKDIMILWEDEARVKNIPKAERSLPLKPAIYIE